MFNKVSGIPNMMREWPMSGLMMLAMPYITTPLLETMGLREVPYLWIFGRDSIGGVVKSFVGIVT